MEKNMSQNQFQYLQLKAYAIFAILSILFCLSHTAFAGRHVILTYDISQSMFYLSKKGDKISFLTAGQFERLARTVADHIFFGNAFKPSHEVLVTNSDDKGPYWREGDGFHYVEYGEKSSLKIGYDGGKSITSQNLIKQLLKTIAYPRGIASGSQNLRNAHIYNSFKKAFPDLASLQNLSEISAWEIFDQMVSSGDENAEVIWIRVSDEDRDHTTTRTGPNLVHDADNLEKTRQRFIQTYKNCVPISIFQIKYCDRIWVTAFKMKYFDVKDLEESLDEANKKAEQLEKEAQRLREKAEQNNNLTQKELELREQEAEQAKEQARFAAEQAKKLQTQIQQLELEKQQVMKDAQSKINAAHETLNMASKDLQLNIVGNKKDILTQRIQFGRKWMGQQKDRKKMKPYAFDKFVFHDGDITIASDFQVQSIRFDIRDRNGSTIVNDQQAQIIPSTIEIGKPFAIVLPYTDQLVKKGRSIFIEVSYHFRNKQIGGKNYQKSWTIKADFPGGTNPFVWLILPLIIMVGVLVFVLNRRSGQDTGGFSANNSVDDDNSYSSWHDGDDDNTPSYRDDNIETSSSLTGSQTRIVFTVKGHGHGVKELFVEDDTTIFLRIPEDANSRSPFVDIDCIDILEFKNGMVMHNGVPVPNNQLKLKDSYGRKLQLSWIIG